MLKHFKDIRIVFMGTPEFAVASLDALVQAGCNIVGVITAPDKEAGRGMQLQESAVKKYAVEKGLTILQPLKFRSPDFIEALKNLKCDSCDEETEDFEAENGEIVCKKCGNKE